MNRTREARQAGAGFVAFMLFSAPLAKSHRPPELLCEWETRLIHTVT
jgi:hypothetical protein